MEMSQLVAGKLARFVESNSARPNIGSSSPDDRLVGNRHRLALVPEVTLAETQGAFVQGNQHWFAQWFRTPVGIENNQVFSGQAHACAQNSREPGGAGCLGNKARHKVFGFPLPS